MGAAPPISAELGIRTLRKSRVELQPSRPASSGLCPPARCLKHRHIQLPAGSLWLNVRLGIWWYCRWGLAGPPAPGQSTSCCSPAPSSQAFVSSAGLASTERGRRARQWGACITPTASSVTPVVGNSPTPPPLPRHSLAPVSGRGNTLLWDGRRLLTFSLCTRLVTPFWAWPV